MHDKIKEKEYKSQKPALPSGKGRLEAHFEMTNGQTKSERGVYGSPKRKRKNFAHSLGETSVQWPEQLGLSRVPGYNSDTEEVSG